MPDSKIVRVYYEGNDDRALLKGLRDAGLLPGNWEFATQGTDGKDALVREFLPFVDPIRVGGNAVVLIDLDEKTPDERVNWFDRQLKSELQGAQFQLAKEVSHSGRVWLFSISSGERTGRVLLVLVGLRDDTDLVNSYGIDRFAIDDHVLRLIAVRKVFEAIPELRDIPYDLAFGKLHETAALFRKNGIEIRHTKRYLHILRAVAFFRPGSATLIQRLMEAAVKVLTQQEIRQILRPLSDDLQEAAALLTP